WLAGWSRKLRPPMSVSPFSALKSTTSNRGAQRCAVALIISGQEEPRVERSQHERPVTLKRNQICNQHSRKTARFTPSNIKFQKLRMCFQRSHGFAAQYTRARLLAGAEPWKRRSRLISLTSGSFQQGRRRMLKGPSRSSSRTGLDQAHRYLVCGTLRKCGPGG